MSLVEPELPLVFTRATAHAAGLTVRQTDRRGTGHVWDRLRRGQFTAARLDADMRWRAEVLAVVNAHQRPLVLSHAHAARAWRLPRPLDGWGLMTFVSERPPPRRSGDVHVLVAPMCERQAVPMGRVRVTAPARTVVDCARTLPPRDALAIADAALHRRLCSLEDLSNARGQLPGWPGAPRARAVLALADGRRETALESWSAWSFSEQDVPPPTWQATLCDSDGVFLGRTDGWWAEGVAGEADGREKYGLAALERGGAGAAGLAAALDHERSREQRLRRAGVVVVRWTARDVLDPACSRSLARDLRSAIERGGRFSGQVILL